MFGRVRPSSSSLDYLERPSSKIFKDDPLSIYEATLIKLKLGSQRDLRPLSQEAVEMGSNCTTATLSSSSIQLASPQPTSCTSTNASQSSHQLLLSFDEEAMVIDLDSSSTSTLSSVGACQSTGDSKPERSKNVSLLYLFSKYNSSRHTLNSSEGDSMAVVSYGSATTTPSSSSCLSVGCANQHSEHEYHSSSSGFTM